MTFLPIVSRELRVAARKRIITWTRVLAAAAAIVIFGGFMLLVNRIGFGFGVQPGVALFQVFAWLSFAFAAVAGVVLTSDSVSEEKREGTLGLLFLTDLRGYDVVLGKLFCSSLVAFYGLLGCLPVIGLCFLLGGISGAEFLRAALAVGNALFFSLSLGVMISTFSRDAQKAMLGTLGASIAFVLLLPLGDVLIGGGNGFTPLLSFGSPGYAFMLKGTPRSPEYWGCLAATHLLGWVFLVTAWRAAPRSWHEKTTLHESSKSRGQRVRFGSPSSRLRLRLRLLAANPILWLAARDRWTVIGVWLFLGGLLALFGVVVALIHQARALEVTTYLAHGWAWIGGLGVTLMLVSQAARFFVEAGRAGVMELLLVSPLRPREIVRGQTRALWRCFALPVLLVLLAQSAGGIAQVYNFKKQMAKAMAAVPAPAAGAPATPFAMPNLDDMMVSQVVGVVGGAIGAVTGAFCLAWFGMWMGLTSTKVHYAVMKTIVFTVLLPWFGLMFIQFGLQGLMFASMRSMKGMIYAAMIGAVLRLIVDIVLIVVARRQVYRHLETYGGRQHLTPAFTPQPPAGNAPPVIAGARA